MVLNLNIKSIIEKSMLEYENKYLNSIKMNLITEDNIINWVNENNGLFNVDWYTSHTYSKADQYIIRW